MNTKQTIEDTVLGTWIKTKIKINETLKQVHNSDRGGGSEFVAVIVLIVIVLGIGGAFVLFRDEIMGIITDLASQLSDFGQ